jgi:hypothetical protein
MLRYLLDEHLLHLAEPLRRRAPERTIWWIGDGEAPARGSPDSAILSWCEEHDAVLVTEDASTMPSFLAQHLGQGRHVPGIFVINRNLGHWEAMEILILAAHVARPGEHADQIWYRRSL